MDKCPFCGFREEYLRFGEPLRKGTRVMPKEEYWHKTDLITGEKTKPRACMIEGFVAVNHKGQKDYGLRAVDGEWVGDYWDFEFTVIQ